MDRFVDPNLNHVDPAPFSPAQVPTLKPPQFISQPSSIAVTAGETAVFDVIVSATAVLANCPRSQISAQPRAVVHWLRSDNSELVIDQRKYKFVIPFCKSRSLTTQNNLRRITRTIPSDHHIVHGQRRRHVQLCGDERWRESTDKIRVGCTA